MLFTFLVNQKANSQTTASKDSTAVKKDTIPLKYNFKNSQKGGLFLDDLAKKEVVFDKALNMYVIVEKIGDYSTKAICFLFSDQLEDLKICQKQKLLLCWQG